MKYITGKNMRYRIILFLLFSLLLIFTSFNCGDKNENESERDEQESVNPLNNKGIGPIKSVSLSDIDNTRADVGKSIFEMKCSACHKLDEKVVGPVLADVTKRRSPEWILNMILNSKEMLESDPIAMELLSVYLTQMPYQNVSEIEARDILEYFRQHDSKIKK